MMLPHGHFHYFWALIVHSNQTMTAAGEITWINSGIQLALRLGERWGLPS
jgi:hypothetical protein